ncbi:MAG: cytochrome c-type biogenesis protein CcmH [Gammaproteobacteria bacterium]|nr:cytochrome c-type biogenesis protein CcmH [Gammaproteobacteria bacterium]
MTLIFACIFSFIYSITAIDAQEFEDPTIEERYYKLLEVIRCPKCLNTNLAGSDAPIAKDLRALVYRLLHEGKSDKEIRVYLVERYGDFILYDPPLSPKTVFLWALPVIGLLLVFWVVLKVGFQKNQPQLSAEEAQRLEEVDRS